jgi:hypothetical protein
MDQETIQQIAAQVVAQLPLGLLMIVNVVIGVLVSALTALGVSYFRTRGQNLATKHDFEELQKQLKANTELVETIKSEVSQRDWAQREWTNLRRIKLEALLEKMHDCEAFLNVQRRKAIDGEIEAQERDKWSELDDIGTLYFRELKNEVDNFYIKCIDQGRLNIELARAVKRAVNEAGDPVGARQRAIDSFKARWPILDKELRVAHDELTAAARTLLARIMNVEKETLPSNDR